MGEPWHDCPACPHCGDRVCVTYDRDFRPLPAPQLWCPACGKTHDATPEARAQAERADAAYAEHQRTEVKP